MSYEQPTGGQINIAGILYQALRTLLLGTDAVISEAHSDRGGASAVLTIEPPSGGDVAVSDHVTIVEQIKMRRGARPWSIGDVAEEVLPDLIKAVDLGLPSRRYRFTTDRAEGLDQLRVFLAAVARHSDDAPATALDQTDNCFLYGRERLSARQVFDRIARRARVSSESDRRKLWSLLRSFDILTISETQMVAEIDSVLALIVNASEHLSQHRRDLVTRILDLARHGGSMSAAAILDAAGLDPKRLLHVAHLTRNLQETAQRDARALLYRPDEEARSATLFPDAAVSIFGGVSGQGKTWALCRTALALADGGSPVVLLSATGTIADLEREIVRRVWLSSFDISLPLPSVARRLRPHLRDSDGYWLTVFLDDLFDLQLAQAIARADWNDLGIRIVISAQPRIERILLALVGGEAYPIPDFSPPELRRYLEAANRYSATIPDDVMDLLARPVFADIFVKLPAGEKWMDPSEYQLMEAHWHDATGIRRDQVDHPSDAFALTRLAGSLLANGATYPWSPEVRGEFQLGDEAVRRLGLVGLVSVDEASAIRFSHDRMLNWAMAEWLAGRATNGSVTASDLQAMCERTASITTVDEKPIGRRLGYVLLDLIWLLAHRMPPAYVAAFILSHIRSPEVRRNDERHFFDSLATIGEKIVPALLLAMDNVTAEDEQGFWPRYFAPCLIAIGASAPARVVSAATTLLSTGEQAKVSTALRVFAKLPGPTQTESIWAIVAERARTIDEGEPDGRSERHRALQLAFDAALSGISEQPDWLDGAIVRCNEPRELAQFVWALTRLEVDVSKPLWLRHKARFFEHIEPEARCLLRAIRYFIDRDELPQLEAVQAADDRMSVEPALAMDGLVRIDAYRAIAWLSDKPLDCLWGTSGWWLAGLIHRTGDNGRATLLARDRAAAEPCRELRAIYGGESDLLDIATLDALLDGFVARLREIDADRPVAHHPDRLEQLYKWLDFLSKIMMPDLITCVARRRGGELEQLLTRLACDRPMRTSNYVDHLGDNASKVLAMMAGEGYDDLVIAEIERGGFSRENGFYAALWTESPVVAAALDRLEIDEEERTYGRVRRQHALAVHGRDDAIDAMLATHTSVYTDSVRIRRTRPAFGRDRIETLRGRIQRGDGPQAEHALRTLAFSGLPEVGVDVANALLRPDASDELIGTGVGVLAELEIYDPRLLPLLSGRLDHGDKGTHIAHYLAWEGDASARAEVVGWLDRYDANSLRMGDLATVEGLLRHEDSKPAALRFLKAKLANGTLERTSQAVVMLADNGDKEAAEALARGAYRRSGFMQGHPIHAIRFLRKENETEAFAAAERLFRREEDVAAAREMVQIDPPRAMTILLANYPSVKTETRWWIGRILRWEMPQNLEMALVGHGTSGVSDERKMAAELLGWLPTDIGGGLLEGLAEDRSMEVELAALESLRLRHREDAALALIASIPTAPKPRQWIFLQAIINLVDPHLLGQAVDRLWLGPTMRALPAEFGIDVEREVEKSRKKVEEQAKKKDKEESV